MDGEKIVCVGCRNDFIWGLKDQAFYKEKGFQKPRRCKSCRDIKKREKEEGGYESPKPWHAVGRDDLE